MFYWILGTTLTLAGIFIFFQRRVREKNRILGGFDMTLFLVMMPKYDLKERDELMKKEEKELIGNMEQVFASFLYLRRPGFFTKIFRDMPRVSFEIASQTGGTDISFYVAAPKYLETTLEKYIQGVYPRAVVEKVPQDYTIFEPRGVTAAAYMKLEYPDVFPINTYKNFDKDPLAAISNTLSKIAADEGAAVQLIISPFPQQKWKRIGYNVTSKIKEGQTVAAAAREAFRSPIVDALITLTTSMFSRSKSKEDKPPEVSIGEGFFTQKEIQPGMRITQVDEQTFQAIQAKAQKQVFLSNIRLVASAKTKERAEEILEHLMGGFGQFSLHSLNSFKPHELKRKGRLKKFVYDYSFRNFVPAQGNILNIEELTSIYHFPTRYIETPHIKAARSAVAPPPTVLPQNAGLSVIGKVVFRGDEHEVAFMTRGDRRRHFYIIGQTGTGKTSLIQEMIRQDIQNGEGVAVIDPHGDLIEATLANVPKERVEDVVLFEPFDLARPMGLNMLEYETPEQKDFAVQEMIAIFEKLFPPEIIGPMFEHYMRNSMLAIMANNKNPGTLVEIPRMFTDNEFMEARLQEVEDPVVRSFWLREWKQTTGSTKSDMLGYVVSKIGRFIENEMMRNIVGQPRSAFDLADIMEKGQIFLANLSKGQTGEINSSLLGLILVSKMQMAAMRRGRVPEEQRKDFYLYIDEFQNFTTNSIATILSEARKYRLNLIMAHQYIPQLQEEIKNAVLGNVGTIGAFRIGANDAEFLEKQFEPEFSRFDLVNLDNFTLILKLMIDNKIYPPFKASTIIPQGGNPEIVDPIKRISKLKYGRPKEFVAADIVHRFSPNVSSMEINNL